MDEITNLNLGEKQGELLGYARATYAKIVFIINILDDIYDVLAIEGKTVTVDAKPSQLWEIIDEARRLLEPEARDKKVEIIFDRGTVPLKEISVDQQKMKRVCVILLRNAIRYSFENGKVAIAVREALLDGKPALSCSIQDSGIGVAPEDRGNIFTKFFRAKNAVQASPDGAGLGLYLAKHFVEAHGGIIQVESELGKGSVFTFVLPQR
jgi:signal transduction histidine kinase